MQITTYLTTAAIFVASVAAQSATTTGSGSASTSTSSSDVDSIVSQLPQCALTCLSETASDIGCSASDLTCLCSKQSQLISSIGPCILLKSGCSSDEQNQISSIAGNLCTDVSSADSSELASASNYINSALATGVTATASGSSASSTATSASGNAAARTDSPIAGMGVMGAAAALAVLAL
ncbi:hypothetical protein N8I77_011247 [Diaporthe amygdali]|uniref:CFEM domain-containing protein n=1 Tax=Phomopsis amygdali TaxID=1214568 RepID=A0AAD9VYG3_PHOAM|nr:hypothetical protein N8I77_011247 [Diaporthe amygdali]